MEVVDREARERSGDAAARQRRPRRIRLPSLAGFRPALVAGALALGLLAGFGVAQLAGGGDDTRTIAATVDEARLPDASASLRIQGDGEEGAILSLQGMPPAGDDEVYQAWVQRDGTVVPQPTFDVGTDGGGAAAVPDDLSGAEAVLVTREPRGGSRAPSEQPVIQYRCIADLGARPARFQAVEVCYRHPNRETGVRCSNCERPICPDCMTSTPVGMRCPECARQRTQVRRRARWRASRA